MSTGYQIIVHLEPALRESWLRELSARGKFASIEGSRRKPVDTEVWGLKGWGWPVWGEISSLTFMELQMKKIARIPRNPQIHCKRVSYEDLQRPWRVSFDTHQIQRVPPQIMRVPGKKSFPAPILLEKLQQRTWGRIISKHRYRQAISAPFPIAGPNHGRKGALPPSWV